MNYAPDLSAAASADTIKMSGPQADALTTKAMLERAADLKNRLAACGGLDDASTIAWLIRQAVRS